MSSYNQTVTISDTAAYNYVLATRVLQSSDGSQISLYYAPNIHSSASNQVKATFSSTNNHPWLSIHEYKGLKTTNPLDRTASAIGSSNTPNSGPTATTTNPSELVFAAMGLPARYSGTQTAGAGYTFLQQDTSSSPAATSAQLSSSTASFAANFTLSASDNWSALVATFLPAVAVSGPAITTSSLSNGE
jgi:hypothetical protein